MTFMIKYKIFRDFTDTSANLAMKFKSNPINYCPNILLSDKPLLILENDWKIH
jgi:hypothetical protein